MLQGEHSAILLAFIKLPIVIKIFVLSIFEWPFYTGFTVCSYLFYAGIDQACLLTKTQRFDGLPKHIQESVGKVSVKNQVLVSLIFKMLFSEYQNFWAILHAFFCHLKILFLKLNIISKTQ